MISIKYLLPRRITGYSKHTPKPREYKELYFNNRHSVFSTEPKSKMNFAQKIKLGFEKIKIHFSK